MNFNKSVASVLIYLGIQLHLLNRVSFKYSYGSYFYYLLGLISKGNIHKHVWGGLFHVSNLSLVPFELIVLRRQKKGQFIRVLKYAGRYFFGRGD